ncbi:MAG: hypothetical protein ABL901_08030 [Hyphomicrobiaceae bacterium]
MANATHQTPLLTPDAVSTATNDSDLPDGILDALSQLYWSERYPLACE